MPYVGPPSISINYIDKLTGTTLQGKLYRVYTASWKTFHGEEFIHSTRVCKRKCNDIIHVNKVFKVPINYKKEADFKLWEAIGMFDSGHDRNIGDFKKKKCHTYFGAPH